MLSKEEYSKIIKLNKLEKEYENLYEEVQDILDSKYQDIDFDNGDRIGDIVSKEEIPKSAQYNEDGTYTTYQKCGEDWGRGIIYIPLKNEDYQEFLEIYYST